MSIVASLFFRLLFSNPVFPTPAACGVARLLLLLPRLSPSFLRVFTTFPFFAFFSLQASTSRHIHLRPASARPTSSTLRGLRLTTFDDHMGFTPGVEDNLLVLWRLLATRLPLINGEPCLVEVFSVRRGREQKRKKEGGKRASFFGSLLMRLLLFNLFLFLLVPSPLEPTLSRLLSPMPFSCFHYLTFFSPPYFYLIFIIINI